MGDLEDRAVRHIEVDKEVRLHAVIRLKDEVQRAGGKVEGDRPSGTERKGTFERHRLKGRIGLVGTGIEGESLKENHKNEEDDREEAGAQKARPLFPEKGQEELRRGKEDERGRRKGDVDRGIRHVDRGV